MVVQSKQQVIHWQKTPIEQTKNPTKITTHQIKPVFPHKVAGADLLLPTCNPPYNRDFILWWCWNYSLYNPLFTLNSKITVVHPNICIVYSSRGQDLIRLRILFLQLVGYVKSIYNFTFTSCSCLLYTVEKLNLEWINISLREELACIFNSSLVSVPSYLWFWCFVLFCFPQ